MLKFIFKSLLFFFPLLILIVVTEYNARSIPSDFAVIHEKLDQNINRAEIIIAGPSHTYFGIKPQLLERPAVSIAYPAQDLYYNTRILLKYLPQASHTKLVIITVTYVSFEYKMEDSIFNSHTNFYYKFWGIPRQSSVPKIADYSATILFGLQQSRDFLLFGKVANLNKVDESGGNAVLRVYNELDVKNSKTTLKLHNSMMHEKYIDQNSKYLDELFSTLKEKNIQAVIITLPCSSGYYNNLDSERYLRMLKETKILSQKYDLKYYNYLKDKRFTNEDFLDSDHLNTKGGEKFTRILKDEVVAKYFPAS